MLVVGLLNAQRLLLHLGLEDFHHGTYGIVETNFFERENVFVFIFDKIRIHFASNPIKQDKTI